MKDEEAKGAASELTTYARGKLSMPSGRADGLFTLLIVTLDNGKPNADALKFIGVGCDVSSEISVQKAYSEIMETYGRIDSVVASAGNYQFNAQTRHRLTISRYCGELFRF